MTPSLRQALALGAMHGPTELLPVSSAGHTTLMPWLAGWPYARLGGELRKSFEVALHAGTAAALAIEPPVSPALARGGRGLAFTAGALGPPAVAGYALGERIEQRMGTPRTIAAGLIAGALAMGWAERRARAGGAVREADAATLLDGVALGGAQALALLPGVSRSGAVYAAARARGFAPLAADRLSWQVGLPVIGGAAVLQSRRLSRRSAPAGARRGMAAGAGAAFASTALARRAIGPRVRTRAVPAACLYRVALAALTLTRARGPAVLAASDAP